MDRGGKLGDEQRPQSGKAYGSVLVKTFNREGWSMSTLFRQTHWDNVYATKDEMTLSWFRESLPISMSLIGRAEPNAEAAIIDVGGGTSQLVDALLAQGRSDLTVLDISAKALEKSQVRLGARSADITWVCADITTWTPSAQYWLWHDRAVFHFLTEAQDRQAYMTTLRRAVLPGGRIIIASFTPDGPKKCSDLLVRHYSHESLSQELGAGFEFLHGVLEDHRTPSGNIQPFQYSLFARRC